MILSTQSAVQHQTTDVASLLHTAKASHRLTRTNGIILLFTWLLAACATVTPSPTPIIAKVRFEIMDEDTGVPVTAVITVRRELIDGSMEDPRTFDGQRFEMDVPVDATLDVQVRAGGYHDWGVKMKIKKAATLSGPIRLKRLASSTP